MNKDSGNKKILLVDDHAVVRAGFRQLLEKDNDFDILEVESAEKACQVYEQFQPHAVIMDLVMPGMGGLEGVRHLHAKDSKAKILVLSMREDMAYVNRATLAGASGYLTKGCGAEELSKAINAIINGHTYLSENVYRVDDSGDTDNASDKQKIEGLTEREFEVFCMLADGQSVVKISTDLHLSPKTVSNHRTRILSKLNATSIVEITRLAIRNGLLDA
ncbi:MAG TPA: response regulator transcription factor [Gammaproteobacteria bacterium]|nr:response regulator transcription factor [Gammaproteobacteria bacterium]